MATSQLLNKKIKALEATLKKKSNFKPSVVAKLETQLKNFQAELSKLTPKKSTAKKPSVLQKLKKMVKSKPNLSVYNQAVDKSGRKTDLVRDAERPALPTGRRVSKGTGANQYGKAVKGRVYYENRPNRIDVKQPPKRYPKLEDGGMMAKGGVSEKPMSYYRYETPKVTIYWKGKLQPLGIYKSAEEAYEVIKKQSAYNNDISDYEIRTPDKVFKFYNGGMMAKGGQVSGYFTFRPYKLEGNFYVSTTLKDVSPDNVMRKGLEGKLKGNDYNSAEYVAMAILDEFDYIDRVEIVKRGATLLKSKVVASFERDSDDKKTYNVQYMADGGMFEEPIAMYRPLSGKTSGKAVVGYDIPKEEFDSFVEYVYDVYNEEGFNKSQVRVAIKKYLRDLEGQYTWGGGDSLDRERVYEYLKNPKQQGIVNPHFKDGGMMAKGGYVVFNYTDNIHASNEVFKTKKEAKEFIENFRNRFNQQGYYRTSYGERIPTNQIDLEIIPEDFNPFKKMADGGMVDLLKADDYVWNAVGNKLVVDKITDDEYYLSSFGKLAMPFKKEKVNEYIRTGQWTLKSPKMVDGGMMAKGGITKEKYIIHFNYNPSNLKNSDAEKIVSKYTNNWSHNNDFDEVSFYVIDLSKEKAEELLAELKMEDAYNIEIDKSRYADGGMMAKGGGVYSSDEVYTIDIIVDGKVVKSTRIKARNQSEANEMASDDEFEITRKFGDHETKVYKAPPLTMAKGGSVLERLKKAKEMGIKGYGKAKEYTKKQIHDQKKKVALDVIVDTLNDDYFDTKKGRKDIRAVRITEELVEEKYAKGGMTDIRMKYAKEDVETLAKEGNMSMYDTKYGLIHLSYNNRIFTIKNNQYNPSVKDYKTIFEGNKEDAVKFIADSYVVEGMAKGGMTEISDFKTNLMGTASFMLQLPNMRKPQEFIVYPIQESDNPIITIQSDTRIGKIDLSSGRGLMSESHASGAYFVHLQMDKKTPFQLNDMQLSELKLKIKSTGGKEVGSRGIVSDNSGALNIMEMGGKVQFKSHRLKN